MSLIATNEGSGDWELCPEGHFPAVCIRLIDKGTQTVEYQGKAKKEQHHAWVEWELPTVPNPDNDNRPYTIGKNYNLSMDDRSNLYRDLKAWRGKKFTDDELVEFDIKRILGACCTITVEHSDDLKWANMEGVSFLSIENWPKSTTILTHFDLDAPDMNVFIELSDKMQEKICASPEARCIGLTPGCTSLSPPQRNDVSYGSDGPHQPINEDNIPF